MVREPKRQIEEMNVPEEHINGHAFHTYRVVSPDGMCVEYNLLMPTLRGYSQLLDWYIGECMVSLQNISNGIKAPT